MGQPSLDDMNGNLPPVFIADANLFIEAHRRYYGLDICPGFWECLVHYSGQNRLLSIDRVRTELVSYGDELSDWVKDAPDDLFVSSMDAAVTGEYRDVMRWVYGNPQFYRAAKDDFSGGADGWLVAYATAHNGILVTQEEPQPNVRRRVPLPNVCHHFGVVRQNTFEMLRALGVSFNWQP